MEKKIELKLFTDLEFPDEITFLIFEQCYDEKDIYEYFMQALKNVKNIRLVNRKFNEFTSELLRGIKRIAKKRFVKNLSQEEWSKFVKNINQDLSNAWKKYQKQNLTKQEESKLLKQVIELIIANPDTKEIRIEYIGPLRHPIVINLLQFIARTNLFIKLIPILAFYKINMNEQDINGDTALHSAVYRRHLDAIKQICEYGGDVNALNNKKKSVVHWIAKKIIEKNACEVGKDINILRIFIEYGADPKIKNKKNKTVKDVLTSYIQGDFTKNPTSTEFITEYLSSLQNLDTNILQ